MLAPTFTICAAAAVFFEKFKNGAVLTHIMVLVRPVCIGLIWGVIVTLARTNYIAGGAIQPDSVIIGLLCAYLVVGRGWSVPKVIGVAAVLGIVLCPAV